MLMTLIEILARHNCRPVSFVFLVAWIGMRKATIGIVSLLGSLHEHR